MFSNQFIRVLFNTVLFFYTFQSPMPEKKNKKVSFTEEDAATLLQRYDATKVLALLQEVAHYPKSKIDWNELAKKTSTGISNAKEYQMLWRHLAYRDALPENFEDAAEPLDDDSDLECELEALPPVSVESASEAAACVKVMIASRTLSESTPSSSTIEAPLTINVPVWHSSRTYTESSLPSNLMHGTSIIFPVTVQRQTLPTVSSTDGIETKGLVGGNMGSKRKRKAWSEEEDIQLRAAVQRYGEGNWATMAKGDNFPIKRSPTQLAQRWSILRKKKDGSVNSGTISTSTQYTTAEQLATRHSLSLALDMPFKKLTAPGMTDPVKNSTSVKNQVQIRNTTETVASSCVPLQYPSQQALLKSSASLAKSKLADEKPVLKGNPISNPTVKSTTAGTQIVSPSNTISQVQVKNTVDTEPVGSSLTKSSISANLPSDLKDKHVTTVANDIPLKQDVNPSAEFRVSEPSSMSKEKVQQKEAPECITESQVDSNRDKERLDLDQVKSMPLVKIASGDEVSKDKSNPGACKEQGSDKTSNFTSNPKATENSNLNKESQDLEQDKRMSSFNESSNDKNMNDKRVNLPVQEEMQPKSGFAKVVKTDGEC
ncbi:hypothetical protein VNO77_10518 [Canavalia gladiata]|uniref:Uncharacterized protein n=1 Tax=Canavalia gladiata TaxID=3824 RepID=A0AAN9MB04_CANGL